MSVSGTNSLIDQTIQYGSIFEAVEQNIFGFQELIDYLAKNASSMKIDHLRESYCALLRNYPASCHYSYGKHLLTYFPDDKFIMRAYCFLGGTPDIPVNRDTPSETLWSLLFDYYSEFVNEEWSEDIEKTMLLCDKITFKLAKKEFIFKDDKDFISKLFRYRCTKIIGPALRICKLTSSEMSENFINSDWIEKYLPILKNYASYISRCEFLLNNAPLYFEKFSDYFQTQLSQLTLESFEALDLDLLKITRRCFPKQFSNVDVGDKYIKITIYPLTVRAYIMGLPCFPRLPQTKEIDDAIRKLSEVGIDEYVKSVSTKIEYPEEKIANLEDTLFEDPEHYVSIDKFDIEENGKIYRFTRPEFEKLYQDKKNFWTKTPLSYSDIYSLSLRLNLCKSLNLPPSDTLKVLLEKACSGTLFQTLKEKKKTSSIINNSNISLQILEQIYPQLILQSIVNGMQGGQGEDNPQEVQLQEGQGEGPNEINLQAFSFSTS
jgi:hypothetical protein